MEDILDGNNASNFENIIMNKLPWSGDFIISEDLVTQFAKDTKDTNEIHLSTEIARKRGFHERIVHGHLTLSFIAGAVGSLFADELVIIQKVNYSFRNPIYCNEQIDLQFTLLSSHPTLNTFIIALKAINSQGYTVVKGKIQCGIKLET